MRCGQFVAGVALATAIVGASASARADAGDASVACRAFAAAVMQTPDTVSKTALADCLASHGALIEADDLWRDLAANAPEPDAKAAAADRDRALASRIPHVVLSVLGVPPPDLAIVVDGTLADPARGAAIPVDPGALIVVARAAERVEWRATFQISERQNVNVRIPPLEPLPKVAAPIEPPTAALAVPTLPALPGSLQDNSAAHDRQQRIGLAFAAGGAVLVIVGADLGERASSAWNAAKADCTDTGGSITSCPGTAFPAAQRDESDAHRDSIISTTSFILAGGLLATGGVIFALAPPELVRVSQRVTPMIAPGEAGLALTGRW